MPEHDYKNILIKDPATVQQLVYCPIVLVPANQSAILSTQPIPFDYWVLNVTLPILVDITSLYLSLYKISSGRPVIDAEFFAAEDLFIHFGPAKEDIAFFSFPNQPFRRGPFPAGSCVSLRIPLQSFDTDLYMVMAVLIEPTKLTP